MTTYVEKKCMSDVLKWESDALYCREEIVVAALAVNPVGEVLTGVVDTKGVTHPVAIVLYDIDAPASATTSAMLVRGPAVVSDKNLVNASPAELTALKAAGIIVRVGV